MYVLHSIFLLRDSYKLQHRLSLPFRLLGSVRWLFKMKWSILFVLLQVLVFLESSSALAFPSSNNAPLSVAEELGCSPTLSRLLPRDPARESSDVLDYQGTFYFDPLGLATDANFAKHREAELKHGRVAMLAVLVSWWGVIKQGPTLADSNDATFSIFGFLQSGHTPPLHQLITSWDMADLYKFIATCGVLETFVLVQLSPQDMPGDYGVGYFGVRDKGGNERSLISELENGRLAMMVMLFYLFQDIQTDTFYMQALNQFLFSPTDSTSTFF